MRASKLLNISAKLHNQTQLWSDKTYINNKGDKNAIYSLSIR